MKEGGDREGWGGGGGMANDSLRSMGFTGGGEGKKRTEEGAEGVEAAGRAQRLEQRRVGPRVGGQAPLVEFVEEGEAALPQARLAGRGWGGGGCDETVENG